MTDATETQPEDILVVSEVAGPQAELTLAGELDLATVAPLAEQLRSLAHSATEQVVIDLRALDFVDSSGITVLVRAAGLFANRGAHIVLRHPQPRVRRVLDICRIGEIPGIVLGEDHA